MIVIKMLGALTLVGLVAACAQPQQTVNNSAPVCPQDPRCPQVVIVAVSEPAPVPVTRRAAPTRKVAAVASDPSATVVSIPGVVPSRAAPPTVDMGLGRPDWMPAKAIPRRSDSVSALEVRWREQQPICADPNTKRVIINGVPGCVANHGPLPK